LEEMSLEGPLKSQSSFLLNSMYLRWRSQFLASVRCSRISPSLVSRADQSS
jgi:hypothetical protein